VSELTRLIHMSQDCLGCRKALEAERDSLADHLLKMQVTNGSLTDEIDRLKAELEKRHEKCKEDYDEAVKNRWDACTERDTARNEANLWKSKAEALELKDKAEKLAEALRGIQCIAKSALSECEDATPE
jgi:hypothetical protein